MHVLDKKNSHNQFVHRIWIDMFDSTMKYNDRILLNIKKLFMSPQNFFVMHIIGEK